MKKTLTSVALASALSLITANALAAPVSLGSIEHLYGSNSGHQQPSIMGIYHPGGNCDTVNSTSVTVKATSASACNRFADAFDFSFIDYEEIEFFELTLVFSEAKNQKGGFLNLSTESWNVLGGYNYAVGGNSFGSLNASGPQTFTFNNSKALFNNVLAAENFMLTFSTSTGQAMNFKLESARLELFGTAPLQQVSEPAALGLLGLGLAGLAGIRRRKQ